MTAPAGQQTPPRDYGGWRRSRQLGLLGLGPGATFTLLAAAGVLALAATARPGLLAWLAPPAVAAAALTLIRPGGIPAAVLMARRARWSWGSAHGWARYRAQVVRAHAPAFPMPGVLAPCTLLDAEDGHGMRYGLVTDTRTATLTAAIRVVPAGQWLADQDAADQWVASWGAWLAQLGYLPAVRHVTVHILTAPEPGTVLADQVSAGFATVAPGTATDIMREVTAMTPAVTARSDTLVAITLDPGRFATAPRTVAAAAAEAGQVLHALEYGLGHCGVTTCGKATAGELAAVIRAAWDPAAAGELARLSARGRHATTMTWADAVPVGADEQPDAIVHDSGVSVSWSWMEAPRQNVTSDVLARLIAPGPWPKRVAIQYRPYPAAAAARLLADEQTAAAFRVALRRRSGRDETARDMVDQARARQAAIEEAQGAGVVLIGLHVTVTVPAQADLPRARAVTEAAAEGSRIRLRLATFSQGAVFAATLPCGLALDELAARWPR